MLLKKWAISLMIVLTSFFPVEAYTQQCEYVYDDEGRIENMLRVDGITYRVFTEETSRKMLGDLGGYRLKIKEVEYLEGVVSQKDGIIASKDDIIAVQRAEINGYREMERFYLGKTVPKWYETDWFKIGVTFTIASLAYGYWSLTSN